MPGARKVYPGRSGLTHRPVSPRLTQLLLVIIQDEMLKKSLRSFVIIIGAFVIFGTGYDYFSYQPAIRSHAEADAALEADYYASQCNFK